MSIIYDALKKVQKNNGDSKTPPETTLQSAKTKTKLNPALIYVLVVCLGLFLGNLAYSHLVRANLAVAAKRMPSSAKISAPLPLPPVKPGVAPAINPETAGAPAPNPEPSLVLNGVFFEQGDGYALINNKIVRLGDEVEKAKVKKISINGVDLEFEGKVIKLASPS